MDHLSDLELEQLRDQIAQVILERKEVMRAAIKEIKQVYIDDKTILHQTATPKENLDVKGLRETAMSSISFQVTLCYGGMEQQDTAHCKEHLDKVTATWEKSRVHEKLVFLLEKCNLNNINKIICFGLGCLSRNEWYDTYNRAATQHAAAMTISKVVQQKTGRDVPISSQDPFILDPVKDALKPYGFTFYEGPGCASRGFIDIDENIFVISISPTVPVRAIIADITRPAILLCDGYLKWTPQECEQYWRSLGYDEEPLDCDPADKRVRRTLEDEYDGTPIMREFGVPQKGPFAGTYLYVRKENLAGS
ncbi:hypothetical protein DL769_003838 [Monosporascus sp. CRB-8-3]|nr:hypothetical protein DL769_003838 [Monosporascus sp. CRB-8-3]